MKGALTVSAGVERGGFDPLQRLSRVAARCRRQRYGDNVLSRPPTDAAVKPRPERAGPGLTRERHGAKLARPWPDSAEKAPICTEVEADPTEVQPASTVARAGRPRWRPATPRQGSPAPWRGPTPSWRMSPPRRRGYARHGAAGLHRSRVRLRRSVEPSGIGPDHGAAHLHHGVVRPWMLGSPCPESAVPPT